MKWLNTEWDLEKAQGGSAQDGQQQGNIHRGVVGQEGDCQDAGYRVEKTLSS